MIIQGKYNNAEVLIENIEQAAMTQLYILLNHPAFANSRLVIMPNAHMGNGALVGFTMTINSVVVPAVVGVDIGCGVLAYRLGKIDINFARLDVFIQNNCRTHQEPIVEDFDFQDALKRIENLYFNKANYLSNLGTLGTGNHFIELATDENGDIWLVLHTGSRRFGYEVANYWTERAKAHMRRVYEGAGTFHNLEYLEGEEALGYLNDLQVAQNYAAVNRETLATLVIETFLGLKKKNLTRVESIHNYIDIDDKVIRKGAIRAHDGEEVIIALNRAYGSVIGIGKSQENHNYSAPHGAGRSCPRNEVKQMFTLEQYKAAMKNIWSSTVSMRTIDGSPMAYKDTKVILTAITPFVDVKSRLQTIYSYKP